MPDYAERRQLMVDTQVRPSDVTEFPIIAAMLRIPREQFVPQDKVDGYKNIYALYAQKQLKT